jgi:hypothetical protein
VVILLTPLLLLLHCMCCLSVQASVTTGSASPSFSNQGMRNAPGAAFSAASALSSGRAGQQLQLQPASTMASSLASGRVAPGAAAAANAGLRVSGGVVAVDGDVAEAGLRVHYDKLTLLLDSGLPMGGNCKVGSVAVHAATGGLAVCVDWDDMHLPPAAASSSCLNLYAFAHAVHVTQEASVRAWY